MFRALRRRDVKQLAMELTSKFGSFAEVFSAPVERLTASTASLNVAQEFNIAKAVALKLSQNAFSNGKSFRPGILGYCRAVMADGNAKCFAF